MDLALSDRDDPGPGPTPAFVGVAVTPVAGAVVPAGFLGWQPVVSWSWGESVQPVSRSSARPTRGRWRLLRLTVLGSASLLLALGAHALGGGVRPDLATGALLVATAGAVASVATARRCRLPLLLPLLATEQLLLHLLLSATEPAGCAAAGSMPVGHMGAVPCPGVADGSAAGRPLETVVLVAHVLATVLTAWLLTRGEAAVWRFADRVVRAALPALTARPSVRRHPEVGLPLPALRSLALTEDAAPRGPPVLGPALG